MSSPPSEISRDFSAIIGASSHALLCGYADTEHFLLANAAGQRNEYVSREVIGTERVRRVLLGGVRANFRRQARGNARPLGHLALPREVHEGTRP